VAGKTVAAKTVAAIAVAGKTAVIIYNEPLWTSALSALLDDLGLEVVATEHAEADGLHAVWQYAPDVVVTQFGGEVSEAGAVRLIVAAREANADVGCIAVAHDCEQRQVEKAFAAGAVAVLLNTAPASDFATAIRQMFERSLFFARPQDALPVDAVRDYLDPSVTSKPLTKRESQILRLVAEGHSNASVAKALWVTQQTVKFHLSNTYRKLRVSNRLEAIRWAQTNGLFAELGPVPRNGASRKSAYTSPRLARQYARSAGEAAGDLSNETLRPTDAGLSAEGGT
jgi:DNA-binding NarL/FixJ family response regulator